MTHPTIVEFIIGNTLTWLLIITAYVAAAVALAKWAEKNEDKIPELVDSDNSDDGL